MHVITKVEYSSFKEEIVKQIDERNMLINTISEIFAKFIENFLFEEKLEEFYEIIGFKESKFFKVKQKFYLILRAEREDVNYSIDPSNTYHQEQLTKLDGMHAQIFKYCESKGISKEEFLVMSQFKRERNTNSHTEIPSILKTEHLNKRLKELKKELNPDEISKTLKLDKGLVAKFINGIIRQTN